MARCLKEREAVGMEHCLGPPSPTRVSLEVPGLPQPPWRSWADGPSACLPGSQTPGAPGRHLAKGPQTASLIYQALHVSG